MISRASSVRKSYPTTFWKFLRIEREFSVNFLVPMNMFPSAREGPPGARSWPFAFLPWAIGPRGAPFFRLPLTPPDNEMTVRVLLETRIFYVLDFLRNLAGSVSVLLCFISNVFCCNFFFYHIISLIFLSFFTSQVRENRTFRKFFRCRSFNLRVQSRFDYTFNTYLRINYII